MKIKSIILSLILALSMTIGLLACKQDQGEQGEQGMLTAEQQVQIAKDTFNGIYNAETTKNVAPTLMSIAPMSISTEDEGFLDGLFDKYTWEENELFSSIMPIFYYVLAQPSENLLSLIGTNVTSNNYKTNYNFINGDLNEVDFFDEDVLPQVINFHGVDSEENSNKIMLSYQLSDDNGFMKLITYYNSDNDYGYEFFHYFDTPFSDSENLLFNMQYCKYDKKTDGLFTVYDEGGSTSIAINNKIIFSIEILNSEDRGFVETFVQDQYNIFVEKSISLEKLNNQGIMKTSTTSEITLDFDLAKFIHFGESKGLGE